MFPLRLGDVLGIEVGQALRGGRGDRQSGGGKQQNGSSHRMSQSPV